MLATATGFVEGPVMAAGGATGRLAVGGMGGGATTRLVGGLAGETFALTTVSSALEGRGFPSAQEFVDNAALILTLKGIHKGTGALGGEIAPEAMRDKLIDITEKTGVRPDEVAGDVRENPEYARSVLGDPAATEYIFAKTVESAANRMGAKDPLAYLRDTPVAVVTVEPRYAGRDGREVMKAEGKSLELTLNGLYGNRQTQEVMLLTKGGIDHSRASAPTRGLGREQGLSREHMEAVANFPVLVENAILGEVHPNTKDGGATTTSRYYAPMELEGKIYVVKITAIKEPGKAISMAEIESVERIYDLSLVKVMPGIAAASRSENQTRNARPGPGINNTVPESKGNVKQSHSLFNVLEGLKESAEPKQQMLIQEKGAGRN